MQKQKQQFHRGFRAQEAEISLYRQNDKFWIQRKSQMDTKHRAMGIF